jgi:outer membrane receptor for ferrienterochelin and colicins
MSDCENLGAPKYICTVKTYVVLLVIVSISVANVMAASSACALIVRWVHDTSAVIGARVAIEGTRQGAVTDINGMALLEHSGKSISVIVTATFARMLTATATCGDTLYLQASTKETDVVVVTGSRLPQAPKESPVIVTVTGAETFSAVQAVSLAEGLSFQPGLRLESNCSNCNFTQVRLNGLQGAYTQILINGAPTFSALNGVYGLEHIPATMIDRIEVVRGGGSALYGAGAIAGTVNVITRSPTHTHAEASSVTTWLNGSVPDAQQSLSIDLANEKDPHQVPTLRLFAVRRTRNPVDVNGDGFSELTKLSGASGGLQSTYAPNESTLFRAEAHWIREYRRGGDRFDLLPFQASISEQLDHTIVGGSLGAEHVFGGDSSRVSGYVSAQQTARDSYYGGAGSPTNPVENPERFFGKTKDVVAVVGVQTSSHVHLFSAFDIVLVGGAEFSTNAVSDSMLGYGRAINQSTRLFGTYLQAQSTPSAPVSITAGVRLDVQNVHGSYQYVDFMTQTTDATFTVVNPRLALKWQCTDNATIRATMATGFRGVQAFDEDLHLSTLDGSARVLALSPTLQPERSVSSTLSFTTETTGLYNRQVFTLETFSTVLLNPFIVALDNASQDGQQPRVATKYNGSGAHVYGAHAAFELQHSSGFSAIVSATTQRATYQHPEEIVQDESNSIRTSVLLRTPDLYGSAVVQIPLWDKFTVDVSGVLTGPMTVLNERTTEVLTTPWFFDGSVQTTYIVRIANSELHLAVGVVNVFNSFQQNLERGAERDGGFTFGPMRPRSWRAKVEVAL